MQSQKDSQRNPDRGSAGNPQGIRLHERVSENPLEYHSGQTQGSPGDKTQQDAGDTELHQDIQAYIILWRIPQREQFARREADFPDAEGGKSRNDEEGEEDEEG